MSEKGPVKILFSETDGPIDSSSDREVAPAFNPEAQSFKPIEAIATQLSSMSIGPLMCQVGMGAAQPAPYTSSIPFKTPISNGFGPRVGNNVTYTAAAFAQTKFGSTKLKSNTKRSQRMSPTEFGNYIKSKQLLQQVNSNGHDVSYPPLGVTNRSLSPDDSSMDFLYQGMCPSPPGSQSFPFGNPFGLDSPPAFDSSRNLDDLFTPSSVKRSTEIQSFNVHQEDSLSRFSSFMEKAGPFVASPSSSVSSGTSGQDGQGSSKGGYDSLSYQNQYQHLLLAN